MDINSVDEFITMMCSAEMFEQLGPIDLHKFDYAGFDAEKISSKFMKNAHEAGIQGTELEKDIADIVLVGLSKGNLRDDLFQKFEKVPRTRLEELKMRYKIGTRATKGQPVSGSSESITFARSVRVFPMVASDLIIRGLYEPKLTRNFLYSNELPAVFKQAGFAALIPKRNQAGTVYFHAFLAYQVEFSFEINRSSRRTTTVKENMDKQYVYTSKAWEGELVGFAKRVELMKKYEINTRKVLETCLKVANKLLSDVGKETFDTEKIMDTYVCENNEVDFELVEEGSNE